MALYSFDGTWNKDKPGTERDTNVLLFGAAYQKTVWYKKGVGTRFGILGKIIGESRARVAEAALRMV